MTARRRDMVVFGAYVAVIYATLSVVRTIQRFLEGLLGQAGFGVILTAGLVAAGVWFVVRVFRRLQGTTARILVGAVVVTYCYSLWSLDVAVERVHFLEYGLLAYLGYRVLHHKRRDASILAVDLVLCALVGLADEGIQWVLPRRVGEVRDVWINVAASGLGLVLIAVLRPPELRVRPTRRSLATVGPWIAAFLLATALFLRYVHGFGYLIMDADAGSFRTVFTRAQLLDDGEWKSRALEHLGGEFPSERPRGLLAVLRQKSFERQLKMPTDLAYLTEAYKHLGARDGLASDKAMSWREAWSEHLILKRYYETYYNLQAGAAWTPARERKIETLAAIETPPGEDCQYRSRVQQLLVTGFSERTMWLVVLPLCVVLSASLAVCGLSRRACGRNVSEPR
jgi:hypothetical protein